jgi:Protein of unknown function (DUF4019)
MTIAQVKLTSILLLPFLLCVAAAAQAPQKPEQVAQAPADAWLAVVDSGNYAKSWEETAQSFKAVVTKDQWQSALDASRSPQGKVLSRKLKSAAYAKNPPNAPEGEYVVIQYDTNFEHKSGAVETVVPNLEKDGKWRVSGYFIK